MSHIPGHIDDAPQSSGKLSLRKKDSNGKDIKLEFVATSLAKELKKGNKIGFHPVITDGGIMAMDIVHWADHEAAEKEAQGILNHNLPIERLYSKKGVERLRSLHMSKLEHDDVIRKTANYLGTPDFNKFYFKKVGGKNQADSKHALEKVLKIKNGQLQIVKKAGKPTKIKQAILKAKKKKK